MKLSLLLFSILILPISLFSQTLQQPEPGSWGGKLTYQNQTTEFYLDFRHDENGDLLAYYLMPVIPFPEGFIGKVIQEESHFTTGSIQFSLDTSGETLVGNFPTSPRARSFELYPIADFPTARKPVQKKSTSKPVWTFITDGPVWGGAAADQKHLYIGSNDGKIYALSQRTGEKKWAFQTNGAIFSRPLVNGNHVYVLSDDGSLYKLDSENGQLSWVFDTNGQAWNRKLPNGENPGWDSMGSAAAISNGIIYVGSADGHLYAVDEKNGSEKWRFMTDGPIHSIPVVAEEMVYFGSYDHHVYALSAKTGELNWKFNTGGMVVSSPVYGNGLVMIGSRGADLFALNASTGMKEWKYYHWGSWVESSGTLYDNHLYIGSSDDQLLKSFDPASGDLIWSSEMGGSPWTTPAVTDRTVFTGTFGNTNYGIGHTGGFFAVDRYSGEEKWRYMWEKKPDTEIYGVVSSPVVANGMVFFGGLDGVVYGFREEG